MSSKEQKQKKCSLKKFGSWDLFDCRIEQIPKELKVPRKEWV